MNPVIGYLMRSVATGIFVGNGVLLAAAATGDVSSHTAWLALMTGIQGALAYAGIGAAVPQVEPQIGNKAK